MQRGMLFCVHYFLIQVDCGALNGPGCELGWAGFDVHFQESLMTIRANLFCATLLAGAAMVAAMPAQALTAQECSAKYQAAKTAGTLGTQKWNDFRKAQCGADATPAATTTEAPKEVPKAAAAPKAAPKATRQRSPPRLRPPLLSLRAPSCSRQPSRRNTPPRPRARRACTPASISTMLTRQAMPTAD